MGNQPYFKQRVAFALASGLGTGYSPFAPGTIGSLGFVIIWYAFDRWLAMSQSILLHALLSLSIVAIGLLSSKAVLRCLDTKTLAARSGKIDPQFIVIDEWAGMAIALTSVSSLHPFKILLAFVFFRFFDVLKPGPVRMAERLPGEWGIMLDDVCAGVFAAILLQGLWVMMESLFMRVPPDFTFY